ncbi:PD-(D/E)XK motif protein [Sphingomonas sp. ERG5]|uniref:PD-(D/E)XK motif protein n=1 Tax=Sphingomonas sp. ERG5 TaxID=1381597 RepID=UPI00054C5210|nr:PD-(D/E)XK motif protein [Sphingomonas sp. ERG5]
MTSSLPWDDISTPTRDYMVRKVASGGVVPVFWGRDTAGRCLLIVELEGDHAEKFRGLAVELIGVGVDLRNGEQPDRQRLVLTLDRNVDRDLFHGLCETLINALDGVTGPEHTLPVAITHIRRWKAFLASRKARRLSDEEVRGLWAELQYMRALYAARLTQSETVVSWTGADMVQQDFIFGNTAVEVKSLFGRDRNTVRISSEDQLATVVDELFLVTYRLAVADAGSGGISLNALVSAIEDEISDADALELYSQKLADFGYAPVAAYDAPDFIVMQRQTYRVEGEFPRLIRADLPEGITRVAYQIELEALRIFETDNDEVLRGG